MKPPTPFRRQLKILLKEAQRNSTNCHYLRDKLLEYGILVGNRDAAELLRKFLELPIRGRTLRKLGKAALKKNSYFHLFDMIVSFIVTNWDINPRLKKTNDNRELYRCYKNVPQCMELAKSFEQLKFFKNVPVETKDTMGVYFPNSVYHYDTNNEKVTEMFVRNLDK